MSNFNVFGRMVQENYDFMAQAELYVLDVEKDAIWDAYLSFFPEGTNNIFRVRTEHDGAYDRNFIKNLGRLVALDLEGNYRTVWELNKTMPYPYDVVAQRMDTFLRQFSIKSVFRTKEAKYGNMPNVEQLPSGQTIQWTHFYGVVSNLHRTTSPAEVRGDINGHVQVFRRGLETITDSAVETVLELIKGKALYRGEEHEGTVLGFHALKAAHALSKNKDNFVWANYHKNGARIRNTAMGTLLLDLSEGKELEAAVKAFETMVAPANYKRPTALITESMVKNAVAVLGELGLESAIKRRHATLADVSINNVIWADNSAKAVMKDSLTDVLMTAVATKVVKAEGVDISIEDFMSKVVPTTVSMDMLVKNAHVGNFVSIIAPEDPDAGLLFKWDNGFSWSYNGNITDSSIRAAVQSQGGRVDGAFRFSHSWNEGKRNASLMDLHVFMPANQTKDTNGVHDNYGNDHRVGWNNRNHHASGGTQDVDYTSEAPVGYIPVENITFPDISRMPEGPYICKIHNWKLRSPTQGGFRAEIEFGGQVFEYTYDQPLRHKEWVTVAVVTLKNGVFTIDHRIPSSVSSKEVWGVKTEQFVKVNTLMFSPNHWDGNQVGNKHWFFLLEGAKNPEPTRGIYNEYLRNELNEHRKVFEVLGSKTMCPVVDDQLSGLGFSSTIRNTAIVRAVTQDGKQQTYNIQF